MLIESQKADNEQKRHEEQLAAMTRSKTATMSNGKQVKIE
jgi:hypothetical protein